jgi:hypothetical protein
MGYSGKNQFWFAIQEAGRKDHGGELNGEPNGAAVNAQPVANFEVYNATWIGAGTNSTANRGMTIREYAAPKFYNCIFTEFGGSAVRIDSKSQTHLTAGVLDLRDNIFWNFATNGVAVPLAETAESQPLFTDTARNNLNVNPMLRGIGRTNSAALDPRPSAGSPALSTTRQAPNDGFYTQASYKGAFNGADLWLRGWTFLSKAGVLSTNNPVIRPDLTTTRSGNVLQVMLPTINGVTYRIEASTDLQTWSPFGNIIAGNGNNAAIDLSMDGSRRFLRARVQ